MTMLRRFSTVALAFLLTLVSALPVSAGSIINAASVILSQNCTTANAIPYLTTASTTAAVFDCSNLVQSANSLDLYNATNVQSFGWYTTRTDASNYERGRLYGVAGTGITIAAETAGTGADNLGITLTPAGTGNVTLASGQLLVPNGTAADPTIEFTAGTGFYHSTAAGGVVLAQTQNYVLLGQSSALQSDGQWAWSSSATDATAAVDTGLKRAAAGVVQVTDGSTGSGTLYVADGVISAPGVAAAGAASTGLWFNSNNATVHLSANSSEVFRGASGQAIIPVAIITAGSGTGVTVNTVGAVRTLVYKVTVTYAALAAAGLTADKTIATLPAKTRLVGIVADTTTPYTGGGVTAATMIVGKTTGGNEYIVSHDVLSAAITRGLADADLGTSINRASAIQGGDLPSWTGTTAVSVRLTTVTANTDQLTAGSTTFYLTTEAMP